MSDINIGKIRNRGQTLLIVEGSHEKEKLFGLIFRCFPEININMEDVWIYGTNIYSLYDYIVKENGTSWIEESEYSWTDIDLPFIISKKLRLKEKCYKNDFTNILLVFDYERHDPKFDESKIIQMQSYFKDATDNGKLYINYPMIESYQHLNGIPDKEYDMRKVNVAMQTGSFYKGLVKRETVIANSINFPIKIKDLLSRHYYISNNQLCEKCCVAIFDISDKEGLFEKVQDILKEVRDDLRQTAIYHLCKLISKLGYVHSGKSYWQYMRSLFQQIVIHNICKANKIQNENYQIDINDMRDCFEGLDPITILKIQNTLSSNLTNGFIWVLNTCIFMIPDYNFELLME